jgi:hypothetical protein
MTGLSALWLPVLLSAIIVFVASSVIHMAPLWHKNDYPKVPNEDKLMDAVRPLGIAVGDYMVPRPSPAEMRSSEFAEKIMRGPVMIDCAVVGFFAAYVAGRTLPPGTDYLRVFQLVGATAFIGYSMALWQMSIWYSRAWGTTIKATIDGLIYALLTAGTFGWLWPR